MSDYAEAGKGDRNRSISQAYSDGYDLIDWEDAEGQQEATMRERLAEVWVKVRNAVSDELRALRTGWRAYREARGG